MYCSQLWRPNLIKDIFSLERVATAYRATKYILSDYSTDYKSCLINLKLLPLKYIYELNDIIFSSNHVSHPPNISIFKIISPFLIHQPDFLRTPS